MGRLYSTCHLFLVALNKTTPVRICDSASANVSLQCMHVSLLVNRVATGSPHFGQMTCRIKPPCTWAALRPRFACRRITLSNRLKVSAEFRNPLLPVLDCESVLLGFGLFVGGLFLIVVLGAVLAVAKGRVQYGHATSLGVVYGMTFGNPLFYVGLVGCLVVGISLVGSWPTPVR
jgi:hypothetical protein